MRSVGEAGVRHYAGLLLVVIVLACGDAGEHETPVLPGSCGALDQRLADELTSYRARLDDRCATASDCTAVAYRASRGDVVCLDQGCFMPVTVDAERSLRRFLDADETFGEVCLRLDALGCQRPIADCFATAPACEDGHCTLVRTAPS